MNDSISETKVVQIILSAGLMHIVDEKCIYIHSLAVMQARRYL